MSDLSKVIASSGVLVVNALNVLESSINENSKASDKLSFRLLILNYIIAGAALIGATIATIKFIR